ncbi:MAG: metal-sulfur cluster assembly factor [Sulfobacillus thermosulfidooxidans]|uniref:Aromatic ring hydroxylase n=1 Tax=Sulfobacillus thermotolerans TaxID=338644 RepID=A0ABM6RTM2_9FIRM|nr:metal-sulfur cluster assembly factor [Sulfobacillus sp. hq2]AUW94793.1 aromatic ring hydroxylase [Sulfobacillus thermotolerans]POB09802.1 aromatic ring hydroxylase [Sulfobacillus sp. hq2]PSR33477.1 MAG: metal-sulfur cluster assembly factor [Sulfobacillus thermosulfidooxidans]
MAEAPSKEQVLEVLKEVSDPEIGVNIVDLGLVYNVDIQDDGTVTVDMTLTAPGCPLHDTITRTAEMAIETLDGVKEARVNIVWSPPWTPDMLTDEGRRLLGF